ncbi:MAG: homoserine dehydrogenase [Candidatus Microthrix parvicella]|jgi:homoserine dehydrogenase|nr:homoserine dehydrogenase [Candidatus Microthrix parvicella]HBX09169.1 homoserine dehydrogenase [Candidatus Microthrix parvicella]
MTSTEVTVGVLGAGNVGSALIELIDAHGDDIETRTGLRLRVVRVAVRSMSKERGVALDPAIVTTDAAEVVADPAVDLVVELMGGIEPARELIVAALNAGKPVVTANKELLANVGSELADVAEANGVDLLYEAAVVAGIPFIRPLRESLVGEPISRIMGIVNGTTNYILSQMDTEGVSYGDALASAQSLGYAERDPTADVEGLDAAAKAAIMASIAFGVRVVAGDVANEGISKVSAADISFARRLGYTIKLLAICERFDDGSVAARVHPAMVPIEHPLAGVRDSYNAVFVEGDVVGNLMFYGRGAGGGPTASAVLGDVIDAASNLSRGTHASVGHLAKAKLRSVDDLASPYYVNVEVRDRPGVLAAVASVFGDHGVSIRSMEQEGLGDDARIVFITHESTERDVQACLSDLKRLEAVDRVASVLRVISE